jgi:hypothetical protein
VEVLGVEGERRPRLHVRAGRAVARPGRLGELLHLDAQADWLAARAVELILPLLARDSVLRFIASEAARRT